MNIKSFTILFQVAGLAVTLSKSKWDCSQEKLQNTGLPRYVIWIVLAAKFIY